mgnify:FL=1
MVEETRKLAVTPEEEKFEKGIGIEISKLKHYLKDIDELIKNKDIREIK